MKTNWPVKKLGEIKKQFILTFRRYRSFFKISFEKGIPRLHIHEKFEKQIKWILRLLLFIGIATSIVSFQVWYLNLLSAIFLTAIEQFLERSVFIFTTLFVTPIPESYRSEDWKGMIWGFPLGNSDIPFFIAPLFADRESATRIFRCLKSWNYDQNEDFEENISLSAIIENNDEYSFYMYPGMERISLKQWEEQAKKIKSDREHHGLVMQIMFCKKFKYSGSNFVNFRARYRDGQRFLFAPYYLESNRPAKIEELGCIVKNHIKVKGREELTSKDLEFEHGKFTMNL